MASAQPAGGDPRDPDERSRAKDRIGCLVAISVPSLVLAAFGVSSLTHRYRGAGGAPWSTALTFVIAFVAVNSAIGAGVLTLVHARALPTGWFVAGLTPWLLFVAAVLARFLGLA
jgi:hypothetical protein